MTNLNTAFDVAEKYLDIPKMLDAEGEQAGSQTVKWHHEEQISCLSLFKGKNLLSQIFSSEIWELFEDLGVTLTRSLYIYITLFLVSTTLKALVFTAVRATVPLESRGM